LNVTNDPIQPHAPRNGGSKPRTWRRLHASTYIVQLLAAAVLFIVNVPGQYTVHIDPFKCGRRDPMLDERIEHGWPWTYLVREERYVRDSATGTIRRARIWSFADAFVAFRPWRLAANVFIGTTVLAGWLLACEYWRRHRHRIWQLRITDLFGLTAIVAATFWSGLQTRRAFLRDMTASRRAGVPFDEEGRPIYMACTTGTGIPGFYRTRGGPSWLRELCGEAFPPWWDRTVYLGLDNPSFNLAEAPFDLADLPELQLLSLRLPHPQGTAKLAALERLRNLKVLRIRSDSPPGEYAEESDQALALILRHARNASSLERLSLWYTPIGEQAARNLRALSQLRVLDFLGCHLNEEVLQSISRLPRLQYLHLDKSDISEIGLSHLSQGNIRHLSLCGCTLTTVALEQLAKIETLEKLNLSRSLIDPERLELLASLPRLQHLSLPGGIEQTALARLKQANPRLQIE
jgi:hypothetical protein